MEISQHRSNDNLPQKETTEMVWPRVKAGRGGYNQEDVKDASAGKEKKGRPKKRYLHIRDYRKEYEMTEGLTQNGNVWRMKTKAAYDYMEEAYR